MSFEKELAELDKIRTLESGEIEIYENILNDLATKADNSIIQRLCSVFEDEIWEPSAGSNLMKTIFHIAKRCNLDEGMLELAKGIHVMLPQGKDWAIITYKTILNSELLMNSFINAIKKVDEETKQSTLGIFKEVRDDQPEEYVEKVDRLILEVSNI